MTFLEPYLIQALRFYLTKISLSILKEQKIEKICESPRSKIFAEVSSKITQTIYQLMN